MNPLCPLLLRPTFHRFRHVMQIALHGVIVQQRRETSTFRLDRVFNKMNPFPQELLIGVPELLIGVAELLI